eukprot:12491152-Alexandrium_andersonii.AAC.1
MSFINRRSWHTPGAASPARAARLRAAGSLPPPEPLLPGTRLPKGRGLRARGRVGRGAPRALAVAPFPP